MRVLLFVLAAVIASLSAYVESSCAEILTSDRRITWTPGVPGGIPNRSAVCATLSPSGGDDGIAINNAIASCSPGQVVQLNSGKFIINSWFSVNKGITLRGMGPDYTILNITNPGALMINMGAPGGMTPSNMASYITVTTGYTRGSTSITVADASSINAGDFLLIDQANDNTTTTVTNIGTGTTVTTPGGPNLGCTWCNDLDDGSGDGTRALGQLIKVVGKTDNTLTLEKGLYWNYVAAANPGVRKLNSMVEGAGIENLQITQETYVVDKLLQMAHCANCWVKNVELKNGKLRHLEVAYSYQFEIRDSLFHIADGYGQNHGYCVSLWDGSTDGLIENNIMETCLLAVAFSGPCTGNVIAYNYSTNVQYTNNVKFQEGDFATHGAHPYFNLFEGNVGIMAQHDNYWGSSSHNVWFRNRLFGYQSGKTEDVHAALVDAHQTYVSFVGNVMGSLNIPYVRYETENITAPCYSNAFDIYKLGYEGGTGDCDAAGNDPNTKLTMIRHGNYDYKNKAVVWEPSIADHLIPPSLYLTAKPAFFKDLPWPAIGPDLNPMTGTIPAQKRFGAPRAPYLEVK